MKGGWEISEHILVAKSHIHGAQVWCVENNIGKQAFLNAICVHRPLFDMLGIHHWRMHCRMAISEALLSSSAFLTSNSVSYTHLTLPTKRIV